MTTSYDPIRLDDDPEAVRVAGTFLAGYASPAPAALVRLPHRHRRSMPWLDRNQLTDLLAAAEPEGGVAYATVCPLGLNGLWVAEADTTVGYDQSDESFHRDPTFVLMSDTSR